MRIEPGPRETLVTAFLLCLSTQKPSETLSQLAGEWRSVCLWCTSVVSMPKRKQSDAVKARIAGMREKNSRVQAAAELQSMTPAEKKARKYRNDAVWVPRVLSCMRVLSLSCCTPRDDWRLSNICDRLVLVVFIMSYHRYARNDAEHKGEERLRSPGQAGVPQCLSAQVRCTATTIRTCARL